jgi:hypothetical protein
MADCRPLGSAFSGGASVTDPGEGLEDAVSGGPETRHWPSNEEEVLRAYYLLQYERVEHHETHRLEVSNYVIAASIVGLGFLGSSRSRPGVAWVSIPVVIALINLLAILYAMRSWYWVDRHLGRAHMALQELSPQLVELQNATDEKFNQKRHEFLWYRSHLIQSAIHLLVAVVAIFLASTVAAT